MKWERGRGREWEVPINDLDSMTGFYLPTYLACQLSIGLSKEVSRSRHNRWDENSLSLNLISSLTISLSLTQTHTLSYTHILSHNISLSLISSLNLSLTFNQLYTHRHTHSLLFDILCLSFLSYLRTNLFIHSNLISSLYVSVLV